MNEHPSPRRSNACISCGKQGTRDVPADLGRIARWHAGKHGAVPRQEPKLRLTLVWTFVLTFINVLRDLVPAVTLFSSFIYAFGCFNVMVFFYVFHRAQ